MIEAKNFLTLHLPLFVTSSGVAVASQSTAKQQQPEINWVCLLFRPHTQWWKFFKGKKNHWIPSERNCGQGKEGDELENSKVWGKKKKCILWKEKRGEKKDSRNRDKRIFSLPVPRSVLCHTEYNNNWSVICPQHWISQMSFIKRWHKRKDREVIILRNIAQNSFILLMFAIQKLIGVLGQ